MDINIRIYFETSDKWQNIAARPLIWHMTSLELYGSPDPSLHYDDVIMNAIASQITSLMIVYSTVYSDADQSKHQSSASLAFVRGIHRDRWIPRTKGQLRGKCFHLMTSSWMLCKIIHPRACQLDCSIMPTCDDDMMASSNGNSFRVTGPLCGEFTGHRWIPPYKGQRRGALVFSLICAWINGWVNNREAGNLRRQRAHHDVTVMGSLLGQAKHIRSWSSFPF